MQVHAIVTWSKSPKQVVMNAQPKQRQVSTVFHPQASRFLWLFSLPSPIEGKQKFQETNKELINLFYVFLVNFCYDSKCVFATVNDLCIDLVYI